MLHKLTKKKLLVITTLIAIFCNILWGSAFPVLKIIYPEMHISATDLAQNITFISFRFFLAGLILMVLALLSRKPVFSVTGKQWGGIILLGVLNTTFQYFFFNIGVANTYGIKASILGQVGIFFSIMLAHFLTKDDKLSLRKIIGLCLGFSGLIIINLGSGMEGFFSFSFLGEGFMILSGLFSALSMFVAKKIGKELPSLVYTSWQMIIGSVLLFLIGISMGGNPMTLVFTPKASLLFVYLALLSSIAFGLWYGILQYRNISELSLFKFVVPISGSILTAMFVPSEHLMPIHLVSLLLVCLGIIIVQRNS